ncbi:hypothetical protein [Saccharothrix sp. HUAS TT1]|uniref:chorismate transformation enzyme, FkbO/Hyg5 family n=1 Tax=unclassified Saccharothrix TaxID=2593673 RepID=UPI00345BBFD6
MRNNVIVRPPCAFQSADDFAELASDSVLGAVRYSTTPGPPRWEGGRPVLPLHVVRPGGREVVEVWSTEGRPVRAGQHEGLLYAHDGELLFGAGWIGPSVHCGEAARRAYAAAFELVERLGYRTVFRVWNAVDGIAEVHADFHEGRGRALAEAGRAMPTSTDVGVLSGGVAFYFLAHRAHVAVRLENPLGASAQATLLVPETGRGALYVSGGVSGLDRVAAGRGDVGRQLQVALADIAALIGADNLVRHGVGGGWALDDLRSVKVCVSRPEDVPVVTRLCREEFSRRAEVVVFTADLRHPDLLVEVEGMAP